MPALRRQFILGWCDPEDLVEIYKIKKNFAPQPLNLKEIWTADRILHKNKMMTNKTHAVGSVKPFRTYVKSFQLSI